MCRLWGLVVLGVDSVWGVDSGLFCLGLGLGSWLGGRIMAEQGTQKNILKGSMLGGPPDFVIVTMGILGIILGSFYNRNIPLLQGGGSS